ncbi:GNAT family N-acetyltransferase [Streptomyces lydicus]|uniref:GNAT family N-acetyltransferase n=1 Tax=Streptomyces lydicus TaxID=47763 RepID=UPI00101044D8|nr:GNAT family N-acetyltransferase [Streptomyces lydicus]MCZ1012337.1 GNAT family N-acetyltransferase [Streptomyces lydicus]
MNLVQLPTRYPELVWELHTPDHMLIGRAEALDGDTVWISRITVHPHHRGRGYATLLLNTVLAALPDMAIGLAAAPLQTSTPGLDGIELRSWYTRHGFAPAPRHGDPHRMLRPPTTMPPSTAPDRNHATS